MILLNLKGKNGRSSLESKQRRYASFPIFLKLLFITLMKYVTLVSKNLSNINKVGDF